MEGLNTHIVYEPFFYRLAMNVEGITVEIFFDDGSYIETGIENLNALPIPGCLAKAIEEDAYYIWRYDFDDMVEKRFGLIHSGIYRIYR